MYVIYGTSNKNTVLASSRPMLTCNHCGATSSWNVVKSKPYFTLFLILKLIPMGKAQYLYICPKCKNGKAITSGNLDQILNEVQMTEKLNNEMKEDEFKEYLSNAKPTPPANNPPVTNTKETTNIPVPNNNNVNVAQQPQTPSTPQTQQQPQQQPAAPQPQPTVQPTQQVITPQVQPVTQPVQQQQPQIQTQQQIQLQQQLQLQQYQQQVLQQQMMYQAQQQMQMQQTQQIPNQPTQQVPIQSIYPNQNNQGNNQTQ